MARIPGNLPGPMIPKTIRPGISQPQISDSRKVYKSFGETLKDFVGDVDSLQKESGRAVEKFLTGEIENVHDVMVAAEKAGISFELMMEIRNKMIDAYHEIMRLQV